MSRKKLHRLAFVFITITLLTMGLTGFFRKFSAPKKDAPSAMDQPYRNEATNRIYNLLFCDNLDLYKTGVQPPFPYPFDGLFSESSSLTDLQKIIDDAGVDPRLRVLACNRLRANGHKPASKELLAVIIEVGLDQGLDVLASFGNGTARYINNSEKMVVWETTTDEKVNELTASLFARSRQIVDQIGPWDKPRKPHPAKGNSRITFLVSDGLYFGEAPTDVLFNDQMAGPALAVATQLMQYITERSMEKSPAHESRP